MISTMNCAVSSSISSASLSSLSVLITYVTTLQNPAAEVVTYQIMNVIRVQEVATSLKRLQVLVTSVKISSALPECNPSMLLSVYVSYSNDISPPPHQLSLVSICQLYSLVLPCDIPNTHEIYFNKIGLLNTYCRSFINTESLYMTI